MIVRHYTVSPAQLERDAEEMARTQRINDRWELFVNAVLAVVAVIFLATVLVAQS